MDAMNNPSFCPVCGYELDFLPWKGESSSLEICPCCGIQFGYHDAAGDDYDSRVPIYERWRKRWIEEGMPWDKGSNLPPSGWNPVKQLFKIGIKLREIERHKTE